MSNRPRGNCVSVCVYHVCAISKGSFPIPYWSNKQSTIPLVENMQQKQESRTPPTVYVMICCLFTFSFEKKKSLALKHPNLEAAQEDRLIRHLRAVGLRA